MATDVEIAQQFTPQPITKISDALNISADHVNPYGRDIAKIDVNALSKPQKKRATYFSIGDNTNPVW